MPVQVGVLTPAGGERILTGLVTAAHAVGSNGGFSSYLLTIEPALALLAQRRSSRVFQDLTVPQIFKTILDEHIPNNTVIAASFNLDPQLEAEYSARSYCLQYHESDLEFIQRLLREEGISYYFTFQSGKTPVHTLVKAILDGHAANNPVIAAAFALDLQLETEYPVRSYRLQYRESDLAFIQRLLREEGISYRFTFQPGSAPVHTLVLFDEAFCKKVLWGEPKQ